MRQQHTRTVKVRADSLAIHPTAQRVLIGSWVKKLVKTLDVEAIGSLSAAEYPINGENRIWIIDGQHRLKALLEAGLGDQLVTVDIHDDVRDDRMASKLFVDLDRRRGMHPVCKFNNLVTAGDYDANGALRLVEKYKLKVSRSVGTGNLSCTTALSAAHKLDNGVSLDATLDFIDRTWGFDDICATEGQIISALATFLYSNNRNVDRQVLSKKLAKLAGGAAGLLRKARALREIKRGSMSSLICEVIADTYNLGKRVGKANNL